MWHHPLALLFYLSRALAWLNYPPDGLATLTHYTLPRDYIASCGCTPTSTHYPTAALPNVAGAFLNFDLAYPSDAIPDNFFPSDKATYGYTDFGVWNITYESVSCLTNWAGAHDKAALGSVADLGTGVCCPDDPTGSPNNTCPSFTDESGTTPPDTATNNAPHSFATCTLLLTNVVASCAVVLSLIIYL